MERKRKTERERQKEKDRKRKTERERLKEKYRKRKTERERQKEKDRKRKTEKSNVGFVSIWNCYLNVLCRDMGAIFIEVKKDKRKTKNRKGTKETSITDNILFSETTEEKKLKTVSNHERKCIFYTEYLLSNKITFLLGSED
jgi:hypothetical protein